MLTVEGLRSRYGRIEVLHGIDLDVAAGEIVTVVGANGAGKTTLLKCLSGIQPASSGSIVFRGETLTSVPAHARVKRGLAQSPEGRQIFTNLTVEENLRLGAYLFADDKVGRDMQDAFAMFPVLKEKRNLAAGGLSGGQQQMLAIARALMGRPCCLLLDEPSMGLAPILVAQIFDVVKSMKALGVTVLLVEQNAFGALSVADRGYVMETGRITMSGPAADLIADERIRAAYLGYDTMTLTIAREGSVAVVTIDNPPVNALSQALRQALVGAVVELDADAAVGAVVLICAGRTFIAGADVSEFDKPPQPPHLPDVVACIENAKKPWIAAIHGSALGGGLEVALGCAYRVAVPTASLGLPEVKLGIIPGAGGTVRLPRLIGPAAAVDLVTGGSPVGGKKAEGLGLIDAVIDGDLRAGALAFAGSLAGKPLPQPISSRAVPAVEPDFWESAEKAVAAKAKREVAPLRALASVRKASETGFSGAMAFERETFLELRGSAQAAALRHVFFAERAAPRPPELAGITPRDMRSAAVIGGGTMGAGIAAALRDAGLPVILIERDAAAVERGLDNVRAIYEASAKRGRMTQALADERMAGVDGSDDYGLIADTDLVIEAVFEDIAVKRAVFEKLSAVCRPDAVLATNTSYLDPNAISGGVSHPERFLGLHFFSPAHIMKLLEIVPTAVTAPEVLATGFALARQLGKIPVRAGICDGFIGNRILKVTRAQAERLLLSGATPSAVDAAMRTFGLPMGPFEAQDLGGLDIAAFQRKAARERGETPFAPVADRLCAIERFGQKSGGGWYDYQPGDRAPKPSEAVAAIIAEEAAGRSQRAWDEASIADAIVLPMVNEATRILEERVALRAADIDLVKIHGYGFPRWRGGPMHYAEARGLAEVAAVLDRLSAEGLAEPPCDGLRRAAEAGSFSVLAGR